MLDLTQPSGSKVTTEQLLREVDEYFGAGATVSPGDTVLDVGANVGAFSLRVAERCESDVRIVCFEPSPATYAALQSNFDAHAVLHRTRHSLRCVGLGAAKDAGAEATFYNFKHFPTNSTFDLAGKRREFEIYFEDRGRRLCDKMAAAVPGVGRSLGGALEAVVSSLPKGPVGWWLSRHIMGLENCSVELDALEHVITREKIGRIDLLKVDVEGYELDVMRGLGECGWSIVRQVVLETHDCAGRPMELEALLRERGLTNIRIAPQTTIDNGLHSAIVLASRPRHS